MPDPAHLPVEIFDQILKSAIRRELPGEFDLECDWDNGTDLQQLSRLTRVNWRWYNLLIIKLYTIWVYNGARHSYVLLWKFLRTTLTNPQLAQMVQAINIGNWGFYPDVLQDDKVAALDNLQFSPDDVDLMRRGIRAVFDFPRSAQLEILESKIIEPQSLANRDRRPLIVMLLISLPNVESVYMHLPRVNPLLQSFLQELLHCQERGIPLPCLRHLSHLYILAEFPLDDRGAGSAHSRNGHCQSLSLDDIWPCLYFSNIHTFAIYDLDPENMISLLTNYSGNACQVQDLCIVVTPDSACTEADIQALITLPQSLTRFEIYFDYPISPDYKLGPPKISALELWDAIRKHRGTLQHLAVFYSRDWIGYWRPGHFGSLQLFPHLKSLDTQVDILVDAKSTERLPLFRLKDTLPQSLETLALYTEMAVDTVPNFTHTELQAVLTARDRPLKLLALADRGADLYYNIMNIAEESGNYDELKSEDPEPYPGLWSLCKKAGTRLHVNVGCVNTADSQFDIVTPCQFRSGGSCKWLWRKTWRLRLDGIRRCRTATELLPPQELDDRPKQKAILGSDPFFNESADEEWTPWGWEMGSHRHTGPATSYTVPFTNHTGKQAFMVFQNRIALPLPPLLPVVIYFTHPDAIPTPESNDIMGLYNNILEGMNNDDYHFRFDVYFLPGASEEQCRAHYLTVRESRPCFQELLDEFELKVINNDSSKPPERLPGIPLASPAFTHQAHLCICDRLDWHDGGQRIQCVVFDLRDSREVSEEEGEAGGDEDERGDRNQDVDSDDNEGSDSWYPRPVEFEILPVTFNSDIGEEERKRGLLSGWLEVYDGIERNEFLQDCHDRAADMGWTNW